MNNPSGRGDKAIYMEVHSHIGPLTVLYRPDTELVSVLTVPFDDYRGNEEDVLIDTFPCECCSLVEAMFRVVAAVPAPGEWAIHSVQRERINQYLDSGGAAEVGILSVGCPECGAGGGERCRGDELLCGARISDIIDVVPVDPDEEPPPVRVPVRSRPLVGVLAGLVVTAAAAVVGRIVGGVR